MSFYHYHYHYSPPSPTPPSISSPPSSPPIPSVPSPPHQTHCRSTTSTTVSFLATITRFMNSGLKFGSAGCKVIGTFLWCLVCWEFTQGFAPFALLTAAWWWGWLKVIFMDCLRCYYCFLYCYCWVCFFIILQHYFTFTPHPSRKDWTPSHTRSFSVPHKLPPHPVWSPLFSKSSKNTSTQWHF